KGFVTRSDPISISQKPRRGACRSHLIRQNGGAKSHPTFVGTEVARQGKCLGSAGQIDPLASVGGLDIRLALISSIAGIDMQPVEHVLAKLGELLSLGSFYGTKYQEKAYYG